MGLCWGVVDGVGCDGVGWLCISFGWWCVEVYIFWVVVGGGGFILDSDGWWQIYVE